MARISNGWQWLLKNLDVAVGTKNGTGVTVKELSGGMKKTVLTFANVSIPITDATTNGAYGSLKIYDFPEGNLMYAGGTTNLTIARVGTNITTTAAIVGSVGTVAATADATLTSTEADLIPSSTGTLTAGAGTLKGKSVTANLAILDGTTTAKDAYLNFAMPDAATTANVNDALLVNGTITLLWANAGDN